jgi:hypothetical protein
MARAAPSGSPGVGWGGEPRTRRPLGRAECQCIFQLGLDLHSRDQRIVIHSLLGTAFYVALVCKVLFVRSTRFPSWTLPLAGGLLFTILLGLWLTSAYWLFTTFGIGL